MAEQAKESSGPWAIVDRERTTSLRRGARLLGVASAWVPIALVDDAYAISDQVLARVIEIDLDPAGIEPVAIAMMAWFALVGCGVSWRLRADAAARGWLGPVVLAALLYASWHFGGSVAVFVSLGVGVMGLLYLRDAAATSHLPLRR